MSVGNPTAVGNYFRSSTNVANFGTLTAAGWFKIVALPSSGFSYPLGFGVDGTHFTDIRIAASTGLVSVITNGGGAVSSTNVTAGDWLYAGIIQNGTTGTLYLSKNNAASATTSYTADSSASAVTPVVLANFVGTTEFAAMFTDHVRVWNSVLTQANLDAEKNSDVAVITANIIRDAKLHNTADMPGWTITGALSSSDDDPYITSNGGAPLPPALMQQRFRRRNGGMTFDLDPREWW